jgi:hypothetical protein
MRMRGLDPRIHVLLELVRTKEDVDGRDKPGHDDFHVSEHTT